MTPKLPPYPESFKKKVGRETVGFLRSKGVEVGEVNPVTYELDLGKSHGINGTTVVKRLAEHDLAVRGLDLDGDTVKVSPFPHSPYWEVAKRNMSRLRDYVA